MSELSELPELIWVKLESGEVRQCFSKYYEPSWGPIVTGPEAAVEPRKRLAPEEPPKPVIPEELAALSAVELRALPEFKKIPSNKGFRTKEDLIAAILEARKV